MHVLPMPKKHPAKNRHSHAASVNQMPMPIEAEPPFTELMRDLATKKNARSKMKARRATVAPKPEMQVLKHDIDISRT